jgi:hypothetical protein
VRLGPHGIRRHPLVAATKAMPDLPSSRKFVLVALADAASDEGPCFPSIKHVVAKTSLDRKTVIDAIVELKAIGLIAETGECKGKTKQIPVLKLHISKSPENGIVIRDANETVPNFPRNGAAPLGRSPCTPTTAPASVAWSYAKLLGRARPRHAKFNHVCHRGVWSSTLAFCSLCSRRRRAAPIIELTLHVPG